MGPNEDETPYFRLESRMPGLKAGSGQRPEKPVVLTDRRWGQKGDMSAKRLSFLEKSVNFSKSNDVDLLHLLQPSVIGHEHRCPLRDRGGDVYGVWGS